jgi:hypothetical protein
MSVKLITSELNGRKIGYSSETIFLVQVGKGPKGRYTKTWSFKGNLAPAVWHYNGINIGRGYKKRLVMVGGKPREVLARAVSFPTGPSNTASVNW